MPRPSFSAPRSVRPSLPARHFTLEQANKTLPLVKRIVGDIVATHDQALNLQHQLENLPQGKPLPTLQKQLDAMMDRLHDLVRELTDVGPQLKDYETGLIDFMGRHKGRDVLLCWRLGEDSIAFWHELNAGFSGRKPINTLDESNRV